MRREATALGRGLGCVTGSAQRLQVGLVLSATLPERHLVIQLGGSLVAAGIKAHSTQRLAPQDASAALHMRAPPNPHLIRETALPLVAVSRADVDCSVGLGAGRHMNGHLNSRGLCLST